MPLESLSALDEGFQAISLLGDSLITPVQPEDYRNLHDSLRLEAAAELAADPDDADALVWLGRRTGYLADYRQSIRIFGEGIRRHPDDARFYRHRGHRYITVREFDNAIADFQRAVELIEGTEDQIEPDGLPNARGIPTSTLHFNIWYHLGLAHYLKGEWEDALEAFRQCWRVSDVPDRQVATVHWLYMILRRMEREDEAAAAVAPITADMDVIENASYHQLALMYKGERTAQDLLGGQGTEASSAGAAVVYGVGNWFFYNDRQSDGVLVFRSMVEAEGQWAGFGFIAAEAELARLSQM